MSPGPSPAAAAATAALCRAAGSPGVAIITCGVELEAATAGACVTTAVFWGRPPSPNEGVAVQVVIVTVDMTDAVFVVAAPRVGPGIRENL